MKPVITSAVIAAVAAFAVPALANPGPEVEIDNAVARVAVVVEDRTDIAVEIEQGTAALPALRVTRTGDDIRIDGGLRRRGMFSGGGSIRNCRPGPESGQPGAGASVEVRNVGRVNLSDAPLIVIRSPRTVNVDASGAVFGSIGRGAASVELGNGGCGTWHVANTEGPLSLSVGGSGDMRAGTSTALDASITGSGSISAGATGELEISVAGSGDVVVARVDGSTDISIAGSGDVIVRAGSAPNLSISIRGSGDVEFGGVAGDVSVSIAGSGDVTVARATGSVSRSIVGAGDVRIGS
jgi:hypothetical protein